MKRHLSIVAGWCFIPLLAVGCSRGPALDLAPVGGVVTIGGAPVDGGQIMFVPTSMGPAAVGQIGSDGRYTLTTRKPGDGALVGHHDVVIESMPELNPMGMLPEELLKQKTRPAAAAPQIPPKYSVPGRSGLSATVTSGSNSIDFALE